MGLQDQSQSNLSLWLELKRQVKEANRFLDEDLLPWLSAGKDQTGSVQNDGGENLRKAEVSN